MKNIFAFRNYVSVIILIMIGGCIPIQTTYFEPSGSGIVASKGYCNGRSGTPHIARFTLGEIQVAFTLNFHPPTKEIHPMSKDSIFLGFSTRVRDGQSVTFDPDLVRFVAPNGEKLSRLAQPVVLFPDTYPVKALPQKIMGRTTFTDVIDRQSVFVEMEYDSQNMSEFSISPGAIEINGEQFALPVINFKKKKYTEMMILNC
jgi:hypothetical protein